jgi:hypothetical protein
MSRIVTMQPLFSFSLAKLLIPGFACSGDNSPLRSTVMLRWLGPEACVLCFKFLNEGASQLQDRVYLLFIVWMNAEVSIEPGQLRGEFPGAARGIF